MNAMVLQKSTPARLLHNLSKRKNAAAGLNVSPSGAFIALSSDDEHHDRCGDQGEGAGETVR